MKPLVISLYLVLIAFNAYAFIAKKKYRFLSLVTGLFIIVFIIGKRFVDTKIAYDLVNYEREYVNCTKSNAVGFDLVQDICRMLNLSFVQFYMVSSFTYTIIQFLAIKKYKSNYHLFFFVYLLYFILIPINQMKDQFAFSILLFAFPLLFRKGLKSKIDFAIGVLAATLFHPSYVLFLAFLVPPLFRKKPKLVLSLSVIILSFSLFLILSGQQSILTSIYNTFSDSIQVNDRYEKYFQTTSRLAPLAIVFIFILLLLLLRYWSKKCAKNKIPKHTGLFETNKQLLLPIFSTACIFVPLLILNMTAYRYIRDLCLIGIIISGIGCSNTFTTKKQRTAILAMSSMISIGLFIYDIPIKGYWNDFVKSFFDNAYWN